MRDLFVTLGRAYVCGGMVRLLPKSTAQERSGDGREGYGRDMDSPI
jgi:hypothetical protein